MREITIGDETRRIDCNAYTVILYSEHKGGADLKNVFATFGRDAEDLASLPMNVLLDVLYCMERTANANVGSFHGWLRELPTEALDLTTMGDGGGWIIEVVDLLSETFFRESLKTHLVATVREEDEAPAE